jgi:hypothetical protein
MLISISLLVARILRCLERADQARGPAFGLDRLPATA